MQCSYLLIKKTHLLIIIDFKSPKISTVVSLEHHKMEKLILFLIQNIYNDSMYDVI
jgi:hypothetical protein